MPHRLRRTIDTALHATLGLLGALALAAPTPAAAQEGHEHAEDADHEHAGHDHAGPHFTHPLIAESVSPDTKIRVDHQFFDRPDGDTEHSGVLEAEYAFHRGISLEVGLPYSYSASAVGNLRALLKFANYAFEESGVLLGYGIGVSVPTNGTPEGAHVHEEEAGHGHAALRPPSPRAPVAGSPPPPGLHGAAEGVRATLGTPEWEVEPYLNLGFRGGPWELTAGTRFAVPFRHADQHDVGSELRWNVSALLHASSRLQPLLELDGSSGISGHPVGEDVVFVSPGLRVKPFGDQPLWVGSSVGFPLATGVPEDPFDVRWITSLFWHFPM